MKRILNILGILFVSPFCYGQFAPQAGLAGSTAIHKDSSAIVEWASHCSIRRGWLDVADTTLGKTSTGDSLSALGIADANIVSLGDGGEAILYFENPITDGPGFDFAIFENGFQNPANSDEAFLELAAVAVSNDGVNYYTFASECHNDTTVQIAGAGIYMDARKINNLAGKYITYYGTPFDLNELSMILALDVDNIHYLKIKDVVGSLAKEYCSKDIQNQTINDPYPTAFPTGGFDLDAVAVMNHKFPTGYSHHSTENVLSIFPNPCTDQLFLSTHDSYGKYSIISMDGMLIAVGIAKEKIDVSNLLSGQYMIQLEYNDGAKHVFRILKP